ncbi:unnamed protein product (macronuclear) [Paramecium tetraurelia]|uniref:Methyltransferase domain-containing protein n=1 Tax=Paramecium tetraurelia TaxID=5888 RepID=A0DDV6_PARTE|nr:uncharacterized protein GSPATT00016064001 [Paramecium tetraurelia]CAK81223.1 unnamed protein product [Paramecium tetraurelia]|eukprot:XP_001448620.1 hypothetical protein (macronuclear) [Paramecium tetraurelia strain d4-2]
MDSNNDNPEISEQKKQFLKAFLRVWKLKKDQELQQKEKQQEQPQEQTEEIQQEQVQPKSQVFSREEYAKDQFWEDRYKEHKGRFDWYVEWPQLKFYLEQTKFKISKESSILMVGCGNSALSEQMYKDGYHNIVSIDISKTIIDRMQESAIKKNMKLQYQVMDATTMDFQDKQFDIAFDKGTLDALSCGDDIKNLLLLKEMNRVAKQLIFVSHSSHQKRINIMEQVFENRNVFETKIKLSGQAELINIIRTRLKDKPLSYVLKDKASLVQCINEYKQSQKQQKQEQQDEIYEYIIIKREQEQEQQQEELQQQEKSQQQEQQQLQEQQEIEEQQAILQQQINLQQEESQNIQQDENINQVENNNENQGNEDNQVNYDPRRQSHCYLYKIL